MPLTADAASSAHRGMTAREWWVLLTVALGVRLLFAFLLLGDLPLVADAAEYAYEGRRLSRDFPGATAYFWPPGMSYLLAGTFALFGSGDVPARLVTIAISVATVALVVWITGMLTPDVRARRLAGYVAALYPPDVMMAGQTFSQQLTSLCLALLVYSSLRALRGSWRWWGAAGLALGVGALTRPSLASVAAVGGLAAAAVFVVRPTLRQVAGRAVLGVAAAVVIAVVTMFPVLSFNASHGAGFTVSTNNERNVFLGNNRYTPHYKTWHFGQRRLEMLEPEVQTYLRGFYTRPDARRAMTKEAMDYIVANPGVTALRTANRVRAFWGFDYAMARQIQVHRRLGTVGVVGWLALEAGGYFIVALLAFVGIACAWRTVRRDAAWILVGSVLAYQLPYALSFSAGGYHMPAMWLLMPFTAIALTLGRTELLARARRPLVWIGAAILALIQVEYAWFVLRSM